MTRSLHVLIGMRPDGVVALAFARRACPRASYHESIWEARARGPRAARLRAARCDFLLERGHARASACSTSAAARARFAAELARAGVAVVAVDVAEEPLRRARARVPGLDARLVPPSGRVAARRRELRRGVGRRGARARGRHRRVAVGGAPRAAPARPPAAVSTPGAPARAAPAASRCPGVRSPRTSTRSATTCASTRARHARRAARGLRLRGRSRARRRARRAGARCCSRALCARASRRSRLFRGRRRARGSGRLPGGAPQTLTVSRGRPRAVSAAEAVAVAAELDGSQRLDVVVVDGDRFAASRSGVSSSGAIDSGSR